MKRVVGKYDRWCLYWVAYDGEEDCFVVARNSKSAAVFDADFCGYCADDAISLKAASIPTPKARKFFMRSSAAQNIPPGPRHADGKLIKSLGGDQREIDGVIETKFGDLVFTTGSDYIVPPREIGRTFLKNLQRMDLYTQIGEEDSYDAGQRILFELMGVCLSRCQEIEHLIAHSFIFAVSDPEKDRYTTITHWIDGWKKKTFGRMLRDIEHSFEMDSDMKQALHVFKDMRNLFVHGITFHDRYCIYDIWGRDELVAFLSRFEFISRAVRKAFRSSYYASIEFGHEFLVKDQKKVPLKKKERDQIGLFTEFFKMKRDSQAMG